MHPNTSQPQIKPCQRRVKNSNPAAGFTIIEVSVSVVIFSILAIAIITLISNMLTATKKQGTLVANSDQARKLTFQITSELRNAIASNTGGYALEQAADQQIIFYSNTDGSTDVERLRYFIQNGKLYRGIIKPTGNPLSYNAANETTTAIEDSVANGATPLFYYYDGNYNGVTGNPLTQPVNVTAVKFVKLNLRITNVGGKNNTGYYTITAGSTFRSLKTNLGN